MTDKIDTVQIPIRDRKGNVCAITVVDKRTAEKRDLLRNRWSMHSNG